MRGDIPTQFGDVLIVRTSYRTFYTHTVGRVMADGQQEFDSRQRVQYTPSNREAEALASAIALPSQRIFLRDIHTREWREVVRQRKGAQA